jgi:hypothetical protein
MKRSLNILCLIILFTFLLTACGGKTEQTPTVEPVNLAAEVETDTPEASPMETCAKDISVPEEVTYPVVFCNNFENPDTSQMGLYDEENKYGSLKTDFYDGKYSARVEVKRDNAMWLPVPTTEELRDFAIQVDGKLTSHSGHPYHFWGLCFKSDADKKNFYTFAVDNNQFYYFWLRRGDKWTTLINGRKSEDLKPLDEGNTLTVIGNGSTYSFFINGVYQEDFSDNRLQSGSVGIYSEMRKNTTLDWEFDNLVVYAP